jgi:thiol-disulfide isomerase/thioredoxin
LANQKTRQQRRSEERDRSQRLRSQPQRSSRKPMLMAVGGVVGVIAVFAALIIAKSLQSSPAPAKKSGSAAAAIVTKVTTVPAATYDKIGFVAGVSAPAAKAFTHIGGTPVQVGGKPAVVYVGAEFCPYCAAERWGFVTALARFGTFKNLGETHSATGDVYPNTPTFSFHGSSYTSRYITLNAVEVATNQPQGNYYVLLDKPNALEQRLSAKYDPQGIPFIYMGNYIITGPTYNPGILAGMTMGQVAAAMRDPSTTVSEAVLGTANNITAAICSETNGQPSAVCSSPGVMAAAKHLPK